MARLRPLVALVACAFLGVAAPLRAQSLPANLPDSPWRLTARPWTPVAQPRAELLDKVESIVNALAPFQYWNAANLADVRNGEITDPYRGSEWQYATPYFAFASSVVLSEGRSPALLTASIRAMEHATADIAGLDNPTEDNGKPNDGHGEFMIAPLTKALVRFEAMLATGDFPALTAAQIQTWRTRLGTDRNLILSFILNNWRTYAMKGEWQRVTAGLVPKAATVSWIESSLLTNGGVHRERFVRDRDTHRLAPYFLLYHDDDPGGRQNFAYHGGSVGNIYDLLLAGYDGPSRDDMVAILEHSLRSSLLLMGGSGDAPSGGRTGDHIWNDIVYANDFDHAAETAWAAGDTRRAGQFRRAAMLAFRSAWRFQQERGFFSVTKNHFHPSLNVGYASWSALTNYNGYTEIHTSEAYLARATAIPEQPTPAEIGGYAAILDPQFAHVFLNAGGLSVQLCTDGATTANSTGSQIWHTLGLLRFTRPGWDSRLGPSAGWVNNNLSTAISYGPTFFENGAWTTVAQQPGRFLGAFTPTFVHPLLVRGTLRIAPRSGQAGPTFDLALTLTPDGALIDTTRTGGTQTFGVVWPRLEFDGRRILDTSAAGAIATTAFPRAPSAAPLVVQAESAALSGGASSATGLAGSTGGGHVALGSATAVVQWTSVPGGDGGPGALGFRYSLPVANAPLSATVRVNGVARAVTFQSTRSGDDWHPLELGVNFTAGATNTVRLEVAAGGLNLDALRVHPALASAPEPDQQAWLALDPAPLIDTSPALFRTSTGDQRPLRVTGTADTQSTFVYPRSAGDPSATAVLAGFTRSADGFASPLGRVAGDLYVGRTSAGGRGAALDLDADGAPEFTFSEICDFLVQRSAATGAPLAVEADRYVTVTHAGRAHALAPHAPLTLPATAATPSWNYRPLALASTRDVLTFDVTPAAADRELRVGLGIPETDTPALLLGAVRFGADGRLSALDASGAPLEPSFAYTAGLAHRVRLVVDPANDRFSLYVKPTGAPELRLVALSPLPEGFTGLSALTTTAWFATAGQAAPGPVAALPAPVAVAFINFQTPASATPAGYLADTGAPFAARGNGLSYGWTQGDNSTYARDRDAGNSPDQRYDTLAHLGFGNPQSHTNTWELALPSGRYRVRVVAGDPSYTDSFYHILAEGVAVINATAAPLWREGEVVVNVTDGRLTLSNGASGLRNKICFIEVSTAPPEPYPYITYNAWSTAAALPPAASAATQDADLDGLPNLLEYALGTNPRAPSVATTSSTSSSPLNLSLTFPFNPAAALDTTYTVERSTDLATWQTVWSSVTDADFTSPLVTLSPGPAATVQTPLPPGAPRVFLRLRVTSP
jgi:hypothetical protein